MIAFRNQVPAGFVRLIGGADKHTAAMGAIFKQLSAPMKKPCIFRERGFTAAGNEPA